MAKAEKPLTAKSSVGDWLKHPVGGPLLREMLALGGQDESALRPVRMLALQRLVSLSKGQLSQQVIDDLVARANGGETPSVTSESTEDAEPDRAAPLPRAAGRGGPRGGGGGGRGGGLAPRPGAARSPW